MPSDADRAGTAAGVSGAELRYYRTRAGCFQAFWTERVIPSPGASSTKACCIAPSAAAKLAWPAASPRWRGRPWRAAGAAVAAAAPASAGTVAPYYRIGMAPQGGAFSLCLQGDLGGPLGSTVTQQRCNPDLADASQLWLPLALGGNIYKFQNIGTGLCLEARNGAVNGSTGFCLDIPDAQATPGLQMQTWRCNGTRAQQFWVLQ